MKLVNMLAADQIILREPLHFFVVQVLVLLLDNRLLFLLDEYGLTFLLLFCLWLFFFYFWWYVCDKRRALNRHLRVAAA